MQSQSAAQAIPFHTNGMRIGLLGGSLNPPHAAHRAISLFAIKRLKLDRVWWLLTPGNPLKDNGGGGGPRRRPQGAPRKNDEPRPAPNRPRTPRMGGVTVIRLTHSLPPPSPP